MWYDEQRCLPGARKAKWVGSVRKPTFANGMDYLTLGLLLAIGLIYLCMGFFRRVARGETEVGMHTILLVLVVAILLVPFVMNVSAHLISQVRHPHTDGGSVNAEADRN